MPSPQVKPVIHDLSDLGLMRACVLVSRHSLFAVLQLSEWERKFLTDAPEGYAKYGGLSWKQRRSAREILSKLTWELERRKELGAWIAEARAGEPPQKQNA
jgi:hypothetical protein